MAHPDVVLHLTCWKSDHMIYLGGVDLSDDSAIPCMQVCNIILSQTENIKLGVNMGLGFEVVLIR